MTSTRDRSGLNGIVMSDFSAFSMSNWRAEVSFAPSAPKALPQDVAAHHDAVSTGLKDTHIDSSRASHLAASMTGSHVDTELAPTHREYQPDHISERQAVSTAQLSAGDHIVSTAIGNTQIGAMLSGATATDVDSLLQLDNPVVHGDINSDQSRQGFSDLGASQAHHTGAPPPAVAIAGQLWVGVAGDGSGNPDGHSDFRVEHLDSDGQSNSRVIEQEQGSGGIYQAIGLDTSAGLSISLDEDFHLRVTNMFTGADLSNTVIASTADLDVINTFAVNPDTNTIFAGLFGYDYLADGGDIIKISYNQTTGAISSPYSWNDTTHAFSINLNNVLIDSTSTGHVYADARATYLSHDGATLYYVDDNNNDPGNYWGFSTNGVFKVSTTGSVGGGNAPTPVLLSSQAQFPVNDSNGYINGIAVDEARGIIYFTTASTNPSTNVSQNAIWWMPSTGGTATKMTIPGGVSVTYPTFYGDPIELDQKSHTLYYSDQVTGEIVQFVLSGDGHSFTSASNFALLDSQHTSDGSYVNSMVFDDLPTLASLTATTTEAVQGGGAITLLTATPSISDIDNLRLHHMTVTITNAQAGDNLYVNGQQSGSISGVTISWNASTHQLTLSGDVAFSTYQSLMSLVQYQDAGVDNSTGSHPTRTINWTVSDGTQIVNASTADSNEQTTTLVIDRAPTLTADNYAVVETATATGTSGTAGTGVLGNDNDKDADAIVVTAVNGSGGNVGLQIAGTYGHLTLNANGSYNYIADMATNIANAANGSHPVDTFTYTVSDGLGGVTSSTVSFTIDRVPTVVSDAPSSQALESGSPVAGNVLTNDSDKDGDTLIVSSVNGGGLGSVGASIAGTYGHISIGSNGAYSYTADNTVAIDAAATGSHLTDTYTYTADDGHGGATTTSITVTLDRAPTVVTDSASLAESGSVTKDAATGVLANDSDRDGDTLTVSAITGGSVGSSVATTYGHITLNADGSYTYNADNTAAIDAAANGSHPIDTVTFTVSDGFGGTTTETLSFTLDRPATATADGLTTSENTDAQNGVGGNLNLLANDTDKDGDAITITAVNGSGANVGTQFLLASGALLTVNADGTYTYDPNHAFDYLPSAGSGAPSTATDTFTYTIDGGSTVTVTITINGVDSNDTLQGTVGNDNYNGGIGDDTFLMQGGGNDTVDGGVSGNDVFLFGASLTAADTINGGNGIDRVSLDGDYTGGNAVTFGALTMTNVEYLSLTTGNSYDLTTNDATVASGQTLHIQAGTLGAGNNVTFDGSAETDGRFVITTGAGNDVLTGGAGNDVFTPGSGTDTVHGGGGNDAIYMSANLTAADTLDGGAGKDKLSLKGDYSAGLTFSATTISNIEVIKLGAGFSYNLTTNDANIAAGETLTLKAGSLQVGDNVIFDGSAETDGKFIFNTGGGNDVLSGGAQADVFHSGSGNDTIHGGGGDDIINMGANLTAADIIDGGTGHDTLVLDGNYSAGLTFGSTTMTNIDLLELRTGHDYNLTLDASNVISGDTLNVKATALGVGDNLTFDGSAIIGGGTLVINAGAGNDHLLGGSGDDTIRAGDGTNFLQGNGGSDKLVGGSGVDTFAYNFATDSTSVTYDKIDNFDTNNDFISILGTTVTGIDTMITGGRLREGNFDTDLSNAVDADHLGAHHAVLFTASSGGLVGHTFLVVDMNGTAGYQAGQDLVIDVTGASHLNSLSTGNFI